MNYRLQAVAIVCSLAAVSLLLGQESPTPYFPLKVGSKWIYRARARLGEEQEVAVKVVKAEPLKIAPKGKEKEEQKATGYLLEMSSGTRAPLKEQVAVLRDGVYRFSVAGKDIVPPLRILKLPVQNGESWQVDSMIGEIKVKGTFKTGEASVGKYKCVTSILQNDDTGSDKIILEYYFASGIGVVKQHVHMGRIESTRELEKYEP
jgi:hypothetical protein